MRADDIRPQCANGAIHVPTAQFMRHRRNSCPARGKSSTGKGGAVFPRRGQAPALQGRSAEPCRARRPRRAVRGYRQTHCRGDSRIAPTEFSRQPYGRGDEDIAPYESRRTPSSYISEWCGSGKRSRGNSTFPPRKDAKKQFAGRKSTAFLHAPPAREPQGERRTPRSEKSQIFPGTAKGVKGPWSLAALLWVLSFAA